MQGAFFVGAGENDFFQLSHAQQDLIAGGPTSENGIQVKLDFVRGPMKKIQNTKTGHLYVHKNAQKQFIATMFSLQETRKKKQYNYRFIGFIQCLQCMNAPSTG